MVDQKLLTIFIAITAVAVLIQLGILVGFYFLTSKLTQQANRAVDQTQRLFGPMNQVINTLQSASNRLAEISSSVQGQARQFHSHVAKAQTNWRETLDRWVGIGA
jgi:predicted PurR-regulated permease PerM